MEKTSLRAALAREQDERKLWQTLHELAMAAVLAEEEAKDRHRQRREYIEYLEANGTRPKSGLTAVAGLSDREVIELWLFNRVPVLRAWVEQHIAAGTCAIAIQELPLAAGSTPRPPAQANGETPAMTPSARMVRKRGPKANKRGNIASKMAADYAGQPQSLVDAKEKTLAYAYQASRDTVRKARHQALARLSDSDN